MVVDHNSEDQTLEIARKFGAEVYSENVGLGYARQMCFDMVQTSHLGFIDSDVEVTNPSFFCGSLRLLEDEHVGAVVGLPEGHRLPYGLPAGLLVLRKSDFQGHIVPPLIDARETYYIQAHLDKLFLKTINVPDVMIHRSEYRKFKPEWEGANTRLLHGLALGEVLFALRVILLMIPNSKDLKNILYNPVFILKFLRGFVQPERWKQLNRPVS